MAELRSNKIHGIALKHYDMGKQISLQKKPGQYLEGTQKSLRGKLFLNLQAQ